MFHFPTNKAAVLQLVDTSLPFWPEFVLYMYVQLHSLHSVNDVLRVCLRLAAATHSGCVAQSRNVCRDVAYAVTQTRTRQLAG